MEQVQGNLREGGSQGVRKPRGTMWNLPPAAMEKLLEDISFNIPEMEAEEIVIDREYVQEKFQDTVHKDDMDRYIL